MSVETNQPVAPAPDSCEPEATRDAVPVWLIVGMFLMLYWGATYFEEHGAWFSPKVYAPYRTEQELAKLGPATDDPFALGRQVYNKPTCNVCHQADGRGTPGQYPPLAGSDWVNEPEPGRLIRLVLKGLQGPIMVNGQPFPTGASMTPFGFPPPTGLTDEEIAAVLTYIRTNKEWGNNAPPVTPEQVKAVRAKVENHPNAYTPEELMKLNPAE